jgi:acyl carrier protein
MAQNTNEIKNSLKEYIAEHFLNKKQVKEVDDHTPLIQSGLLDSISTMQLVVHLEKTFHIEFEAHEVDKDNFENIETIAQLVSSKL